MVRMYHREVDFYKVNDFGIPPPLPPLDAMAAPAPPTTTTRAITALTALPALRVPTIRPGRTPNLARPTNYEAYLGGVAGTVNA